MDRAILIGDVHGCLEELKELLTLVDFRQGEDRLVFLGDLIDRGPYPAECVQLARELGGEAVVGNHEEKALRWLKHEAKAKADSAYKNPMRKPHPDRQAQHEALTPEDIAWLSDLPICLDLGNDWVAVHGGLEPALSMGSQKPDRVMRLRWVDSEGAYLPLREEDVLDKPEGAFHWAELWEGPFHVAYGHSVHSMEVPRFDKAGDFECWGLDTGCCFGGKLTAMTLPDKKLFQVKAKRVYAQYLRPTT